MVRVKTTLIALVTLLGCGGDRDTLLQLDVVIPAGPPTAIEIEVAHQEMRTYDGALPAPGATLGVDLYLPRRLTGDQPVDVRAVDADHCVVAEQTITVTLKPGEKIAGGLVTLVAVPRRCVPPDASAGTDGGEGADGSVDTGPSDGPAVTIDGAPAETGPPPPPPPDAGRDAAVDAAADVAPDAPPADTGPTPCTTAASCPANQNCLAGTCQPPQASCADILSRQPGAPDGVYILNNGGTVEPAYCDMRLKRVLCAKTEGDHTGLTRDGALNGAGLTFTLRSVLEPPNWDTCRVWAVRHETGGPFVEPLGSLEGLAAAPDAKVKSTCEALGFKADQDVQLLCYYGSTIHCGFNVEVVQRPNGRTVSKWSNTCDCNPNQGRPFYSLEDRVQVSHIPWNTDGSNSARCKTR